MGNSHAFDGAAMPVFAFPAMNLLHRGSRQCSPLHVPITSEPASRFAFGGTEAHSPKL